ncbi:hypothetical protein NM208_g4519 [Fusarium decemcellulare]|uniref:Uncharacterized protein n=1 Tax=Fusarium decemcellulare TaxID=57161 RepID=A0ACC1SKC5_9HYPO|nr:hypothetical protein NM208_g4519 [Fusarium decemcellulare]
MGTRRKNTLHTALPDGGCAPAGNDTGYHLGHSFGIQWPTARTSRDLDGELPSPGSTACSEGIYTYLDIKFWLHHPRNAGKAIDSNNYAIKDDHPEINLYYQLHTLIQQHFNEIEAAIAKSAAKNKNNQAVSKSETSTTQKVKGQVKSLVNGATIAFFNGGYSKHRGKSRHWMAFVPSKAELMVSRFIDPYGRLNSSIAGPISAMGLGCMLSITGGTRGPTTHASTASISNHQVNLISLLTPGVEHANWSPLQVSTLVTRIEVNGETVFTHLKDTPVRWAIIQSDKVQQPAEPLEDVRKDRACDRSGGALVSEEAEAHADNDLTQLPDVEFNIDGLVAGRATAEVGDAQKIDSGIMVVLKNEERESLTLTDEGKRNMMMKLPAKEIDKKQFELAGRNHQRNVSIVSAEGKRARDELCSLHVILSTTVVNLLAQAVSSQTAPTITLCHGSILEQDRPHLGRQFYYYLSPPTRWVELRCVCRGMPANKSTGSSQQNNGALTKVVAHCFYSLCNIHRNAWLQTPSTAMRAQQTATLNSIYINYIRRLPQSSTIVSCSKAVEAAFTVAKKNPNMADMPLGRSDHDGRRFTCHMHRHSGIITEHAITSDLSNVAREGSMLSKTVNVKMD